MADLSFPSQDATSFDPATQSNDSIDQTLDADIDMVIDPAPQSEDPLVEPPPEPRVPARKDISLRDFLSKMDDYAPIVGRPQIFSLDFTRFFVHYPEAPRKLTARLDPRCCHSIPPHSRRTPALHHPSSPLSPPRSRHPEVHRRHCRRRLPVLAHALFRLWRLGTIRVRGRGNRGCDNRLAGSGATDAAAAAAEGG